MFMSGSLWAAWGTFRVAVFPPVLGPVMMTLRSSGFTQMLMGTGGRLWGDSSDSLSLPSASESVCSGSHPVNKPSLQDITSLAGRQADKRCATVSGELAQQIISDRLKAISELSVT